MFSASQMNCNNKKEGASGCVLLQKVHIRNTESVLYFSINSSVFMNK